MTLEKLNTFNAKDIKTKIFETFPSMSRSKKIKLVTQMIPSFNLAVASAQLLDRGPLPIPEPINCDISDDYLILRDVNGDSIADVYVGSDNTYHGHVIFNNGTHLNTHERLVLEGHDVTNDYIADCPCATCSELKNTYALEQSEKHLTRNSQHVLNVHVPSELKIKDTSDKLQSAMQDSKVVSDPSTKPKITSYHPMRRDGNVSYPNQ